MLFKLLASNARLDFLLSRNDISAGESLGDSYTFGMAGTGGTSSSSSPFDVLCRFKAFGAGNLELPPCEFRAWIDPVDVRTVLKLFTEPTESPELYDFLFGSGVVREEEGVEILRGSMDGERDEARTSVDSGGGGFIDACDWSPWFWCIFDIRFIRLVSVGLMVRAPRPVACEAWGTPGIIDIRFPDNGLEPFAAVRGERGRAIDIWLWSTVKVLVSGDNVDWLARAGGCTDLALEAREPVRFRVTSPKGRGPPSIDERVESKPFLSDTDAALGLRFRDSKSLLSKTPGPTDFLGGFTMFVLETGG